MGEESTSRNQWRTIPKGGTMSNKDLLGMLEALVASIKRYQTSAYKVANETDNKFLKASLSGKSKAYLHVLDLLNNRVKKLKEYMQNHPTHKF